MSDWPSVVRGQVESVLARHNVPGMVVAAARGDGPAATLAVGVDGQGQPLTGDALLPVASITKLATALAVLRLADRSALSVDDPLARHVPEAAVAQAGVTLRHLLSHSAGLDGNFAESADFWRSRPTWATIVAASLPVGPAWAPGTRVLYSGLGYTLLAVTIERASGLAFGDALHELVFGPLGVEAYAGVEPPRLPAHIRPYSPNEFTDTDLDRPNSAFARSLALPYVGLVTTATGSLALVRAFAGTPAGFLRPETRAAATSDAAGGLPGGYGDWLSYDHCPWGLGPELRGAKQPHWATPAAGPDSFGHVGGSGCMAWCDPSTGVAWSAHATLSMAAEWSFDAMPTIGAALLAAVNA